MASRPIDAAAIGAHTQRAAGRPRPFRHPRCKVGWCRLERPVVDNAAGKWRTLPSIPRESRRTSAASSTPVPVIKTAFETPAAVAASSRSLVSKMRSSSAQHAASSRSERPPSAMSVSYPATRSHRPRPRSISSHRNRTSALCRLSRGPRSLRSLRSRSRIQVAPKRKRRPALRPASSCRRIPREWPHIRRGDGCLSGRY